MYHHHWSKLVASVGTRRCTLASRRVPSHRAQAVGTPPGPVGERKRSGQRCHRAGPIYFSLLLVSDAGRRFHRTVVLGSLFTMLPHAEQLEGLNLGRQSGPPRTPWYHSRLASRRPHGFGQTQDPSGQGVDGDFPLLLFSPQHAQLR